MVRHYYIDLTFANSEHLSPTCRAYTLSRRSAILHANTLSVFHFFLGTTFHTIRLHSICLLFNICSVDDKLLLSKMPILEISQAAGLALGYDPEIAAIASPYTFSL